MNLSSLLLILSIFVLSLCAYGAENPQRELRQLYKELAEKRAQIQVQADNFHLQILKRDDAFSAPPLQSRLTSLYENIEEIKSSIEYIELVHGIPADQTKIRAPRLHPDVVVRIEYYRNKVSSSLREYLSKREPHSIQFNSITPAPPGFSNTSGYPRERIRKDPRYRCATGGFMTSSVAPQNIPNRGGIPHRIEYSHDYICKTPQKVKLSLDGRPIELRCGPPNIQKPNLKTTFEQMNMCDPLLYGFYPYGENSPRSAVAACTFPKQHSMGRERTYSENMATQQKTTCDVAAERTSRSLKSLFPESRNNDLSLILAAKLARENPELWTQKQQRIEQTCGPDSQKTLIKDQCAQLMNRIKKIKETLLGTQTLEPSDDESLTSDY